MLLVFMYHDVWRPELPSSVEIFRQHLIDLAQRYPIVMPGNSLGKWRFSVCLTFDDASFDFYHIVYPLLRQLNIRAMLAVPVKFIVEDTSLTPAARLNVPYARRMEGDTYQTHVPFCTWREIREMVASGHVAVASHSYNHVNLNQPGYDFQQEIMASRQILIEKTASPVTTFVYPFGKMNRHLNHQVLQHYAYAMRIGSALNRDWQNYGSRLIYRVDADSFWQRQIKWSKRYFFKYGFKYLSNLMRRC